MTLVETMIALIVLVTGVAAVFGMASHVHHANRNLSFQTQSVDIFTRVAAQIRDAQCDFPAGNPGAMAATMDPGLNVPVGLWITAPVGGSSITFVGITDGASLPMTVPRMQIDYRVTPDNSTTVPAFDIDVRVRELFNDGRDNAAIESQYWVRTYPVKKVCNPRLDETSRGEFLGP